MVDYTEEDVGNIVLLEHVNVQIPDQLLATTFYVLGLGFTRDPYLNIGLNNMWVNLGEQQFHLPTRSPQKIDGHIGGRKNRTMSQSSVPGAIVSGVMAPVRLLAIWRWECLMWSFWSRRVKRQGSLASTIR
jgi:hypothetical protein